MKKFLPIVVVCILVLSGIGAVAFPEEDNNYLEKEVTLSFSKPTIQDNDQYISLDIDESNRHITEPGKPMLPMYVKTIDLPFGVTDINVYCTIQNIQEMTISKSIIPTPESIPLASTKKFSKEKLIDETVYSSYELYPTDWYSYRVGCGLSINGEHVTHVAIQIYPIRYSPAASKLYYIEDMDIEINYVIPIEPVTFADAYDLVIITPRKFSILLNRLVSHKNRFGVNTTLKTTEDIYDEYTGVDKPEQIKYFIKDAIEQWGVQYVLLVGGLKRYLDNEDKDNCNEGSSAWHVPVRYTNLYDDDPENCDPGFISDLYYADVFKGGGAFENWDSNGDGIFAAFDRPGVPNDVLDLYPDVCVGRLACRNIFEVMIMVNKIINYEKSVANPVWFNKMACVAGDTFPSEITYEGEAVCEEAIGVMDGIEPVRIFASNRDSGTGPTPSPENITTAISDGCGFLLFEGHGSPGTWGTRYPGGEERTPPYLVYHFPQLKNGKKLPITIIGGCHNSLFNVSIQKTYGPDNESYWSRGLPLPECFSWWLTRKINGGSIATIGCTALEYGVVDFPLDGLGGYMDYLFFWAYGQMGEHVLGETWLTALSRYIDDSGFWGKTDVKIIEIWTLLGDPSLMIGGYT